MAIILSPWSVIPWWSRRTYAKPNFLKDNNIEMAVDWLASNLFYSTGIPVLFLVLKKM